VERIKFLLQKLGIDKAISFVLLGRGFSFIAQPITLYLIAKFFSPTEQGFYYTFGSILATSIFFELGLGLVLTQFASHEFALLKWNSDGSLSGDEISLSRLLSLLKMSMKWYGILSIIFFIVLIPVGMLFFSPTSQSSNVEYFIPWILLLFFSALGLYIFPLLAIIEGCGRVIDIQRMRFYQLIYGVLSVWIIIFMKGTLLAASILAFTSFVVSIVWLNKNFKGLFSQLKGLSNIKANFQISWRKEIFPMQWRIAISWSFGYFIYQLFNPLLFKYQSATIAGQMGMSMQVANVVMGTSAAWISTKFPLYGSLIKKKQYKELDKLAFRSSSQAVFFSVGLSIAAVIFVHFLKTYYPHFGQRILSTAAIAALLFSNIINVIIASMAGYLRAHKEEPYLINSVIGAIITSIVAWTCAKYFNADILCYTIAVTNLLIGLPFAVFIFRKKRIDWGADKIRMELTEVN